MCQKGVLSLVIARLAKGFGCWENETHDAFRSRLSILLQVLWRRPTLRESSVCWGALCCFRGVKVAIRRVCLGRSPPYAVRTATFFERECRNYVEINASAIRRQQKLSCMLRLHTDLLFSTRSTLQTGLSDRPHFAIMAGLCIALRSLDFIIDGGDFTPTSLPCVASQS